MRALAFSTVLILSVASCGGDDTPDPGGSAVPASAVSAPETVVTSPPPNSDPVESAVTAPPSSVPADSVATTPSSDSSAPDTTAATTSAAIAWTDVDAYPSGFEAGCCGANSAGPTSPALTEAPAPLADGAYSLEVVGWSPDDPTLLQISVRAFVPCADGVKECSPLLDGTYGPREIGFSETSREIDVVLDDSVVVYLAGDDASRSLEDGLSSILRSTGGNGLAALMTAIADAYDTAIATPLSAGTPIDDIVAGIQANPAHGFTSAAEQLTGQLYFTFDDAPPVLFQAVADQGAPLERSGTSALIPRTFTLEDGTISLEFYAGFRS